MNQQNKHIFFLVIIIFLSRLPFLSAGYGAEEDSWGIALAAHNTKTTGVFEVSRFPGHPFQELIYSALWGIGPFGYNVLSTVFCVFASVFLFLILKHFQADVLSSFFGSLAFAFTPIIFISSTYTIDYIWTIAFVLASFYFLLKEKTVLAAIFIGIAIGCRITAGAMLLPMAYWIFEKENTKESIKKIAKMSLIAIVVGSALFLPVVWVYGKEFFMYYDQFPYPPMAKVLYKATIGVWGLVGFVSLLFFFAYILIKKTKPNLYKNKIIVFVLLTLMLYTISYFRLPQKSGYWIPVVPFFILLFFILLNKKQFYFFCCLLSISSFCFSINLTDPIRGSSYSTSAIKYTISGQEIFLDPLSGPVFADYTKRLQKLNYTDRVLKRIESTKEKKVLICGWWYNELMVKSLDKEMPGHVVLEGYIDQEKMLYYKTMDHELFYLPEQEIYNDLLFNIQGATKQNCQPF